MDRDIINFHRKLKQDMGWSASIPDTHTPSSSSSSYDRDDDQLDDFAYGDFSREEEEEDMQDQDQDQDREEEMLDVPASTSAIVENIEGQGKEEKEQKQDDNDDDLEEISAVEYQLKLEHLGHGHDIDNTPRERADRDHRDTGEVHIVPLQQQQWEQQNCNDKDDSMDVVDKEGQKRRVGMEEDNDSSDVALSPIVFPMSSKWSRQNLSRHSELEKAEKIREQTRMPTQKYRQRQRDIHEGGSRKYHSLSHMTIEQKEEHRKEQSKLRGRKARALVQQQKQQEEQEQAATAGTRQYVQPTSLLKTSPRPSVDYNTKEQEEEAAAVNLPSTPKTSTQTSTSIAKATPVATLLSSVRKQLAAGAMKDSELLIDRWLQPSTSESINAPDVQTEVIDVRKEQQSDKSQEDRHKPAAGDDNSLFLIIDSDSDGNNNDDGNGDRDGDKDIDMLAGEQDTTRKESLKQPNIGLHPKTSPHNAQLFDRMKDESFRNLSWEI